jgi:hypothetical protein
MSDCDHFAIRSHGQITCRYCQAVWRMDCDGSRWVLPIGDGVAACSLGSCQRHGQCMYANHPRCPLRYEE